MNTRRIASLCLPLGILLAAGLAGCTTGHAGASASPSAAALRQELIASVGALSTTSYAVTLTTPQYHANGAVDPVSGDIDLTATGTEKGQSITVEAMTVGPDNWARVDAGAGDEELGITPNKWLRLDPLDLGATSLPFDRTNLADAFDMQDVLDGVTSVSRTDGEHLTGRINLADVQVNSMIPTGKAVGAGGTDLPFTATIDASGRLTEFVVVNGGAPTFDFSVSDYGAAARVTPPDDINVIKAPASAYSLLSLR